MKHIKKLLLLFGFSFVVLVTFSQNLESIIEKAKNDFKDTAQLNRVLYDIYYDEAIRLSKANLHLAKEYSRISFSLAEELNNDTLLAKSSRTLGVFYSMEKKMDSSIFYIKTAKEIYTGLSNMRNKLAMNSLLVNSYAKLFKFDSAYVYLNESEYIYKQNDSLKDGLYIFFKIQKANFFYQLKLYHYALEEFYEAKYYSQKLNITDFNPNIIGGIGAIYATTANYHKAIKFYKKALSKLEKYHIDRAIVFNNVGNSYARLNNIDSALHYYKESINVYKSINVDVNLIYKVYLDIYENISSLNKDTALYYFNLIDPNLLNSQIYPLYIFVKSDIASGKEQKAKYLHQILDNYYDNIDINLKTKVYFDLYSIYLAQNNHLLALNNYSKYVDLKDSIYNHEKTLSLHNVIVDNLIKENEIAIKTQVLEFELKEKQKNIWIILLASCIIVLVLLGLIIYYSLLSQKQKNIIIENKNKFLNQQSEEVKSDIINLSIELYKNNTFIKNLENELKSLRNQPEQSFELRNLYSQTKQFIIEGENKKSFNEKINAIKNDFFIKLENIATLTKTEKKLAALLKLKMSSKEIAPILNVSEKSIEIYRTRLRKKLKISKETTLSDFLNAL